MSEPIASLVSLESSASPATEALTGAQRRKLRAEANHLDPLFRIGKQGLTSDLAGSLKVALLAHELVKVRFVAFKEERQELSRTLAAQTESELVQVLGHTALFYKRHPDPQKRTHFK